MNEIADRIRKRRKELNLTQGELGRLSGLGTATISGLELGTQKSTTRWYDLAVALQCRLEWLQTGAPPVAQFSGVAERSPTDKLTIHDVKCSRDGALIGAEWDKIEGDEYRKLAHDFVFALVTAQKNAARRPSKLQPASSSPRGPKTSKGQGPSKRLD